MLCPDKVLPVSYRYLSCGLCVEIAQLLVMALFSVSRNKTVEQVSYENT